MRHDVAGQSGQCTGCTYSQEVMKRPAENAKRKVGNSKSEQLLQIICKSYSAETKIAGHGQRKSTLDWIGATVFSQKFCPLNHFWNSYSRFRLDKMLNKVIPLLSFYRYPSSMINLFHGPGFSSLALSCGDGVVHWRHWHSWRWCKNRLNSKLWSSSRPWHWAGVTTGSTANLFLNIPKNTPLCAGSLKGKTLAGSLRAYMLWQHYKWTNGNKTYVQLPGKKIEKTR